MRVQRGLVAPTDVPSAFHDRQPVARRSGADGPRRSDDDRTTHDEGTGALPPSAPPLEPSTPATSGREIYRALFSLPYNSLSIGSDDDDQIDD